MKVLITGAAGFVGTNLCLKLLRDGHEVYGVDSLSRKGSELNLQAIKNQFPSFNFVKKEIEDIPFEINKISPEIVYHFAAQVAVTSSLENPKRDFMINALGTFNIVLAAKKIGTPVIYTSTNKVFGDNVNKIPIIELETRYDFDGEFHKRGVNEDFPIDAKHHTPYGCSKLVGDIYVREFGGVVNRCSCMYGENQYGIADQGWLSHLAQNKILGRPTIIYGNGKQVRDALHIDDVVRLLDIQRKMLTENLGKDIRGEVFNVGGGYINTLSLNELCQKWDIKPTYGEWRLADQKVFYCDISKAKNWLGWKPEINLPDGLDRLYKWTQKNISV